MLPLSRQFPEIAFKILERSLQVNTHDVQVPRRVLIGDFRFFPQLAVFFMSDSVQDVVLKSFGVEPLETMAFRAKA